MVFQWFLIVFKSIYVFFSLAILKFPGIPLKTRLKTIDMPLKVQNGHKIKRPVEKSMNHDVCQTCWYVTLRHSSVYCNIERHILR